VLKVEGACCGYGAIQVLWNVDLAVTSGEIVALVGANGAGKTTLLRALAGLQGFRSGIIEFDGESITGLSPAERVKRGIVLVPENRRLFFGLTVEQNLRLGAFTRPQSREVEDDLARIYDVFPVLKQRRSQFAGNMSGGEQQMCAIARGLMSRPRLLMIDELSLGLAPIVVENLFSALIEVRRLYGTTLFLVEQDVQIALEAADRGYVLEMGRVVMTGQAQELLDRPEIRAAYLGL
jgi:branched-chain amino acid transport system ATP-binding protein